jgi:hypothetical protein
MKSLEAFANGEPVSQEIVQPLLDKSRIILKMNQSHPMFRSLELLFIQSWKTFVDSKWSESAVPVPCTLTHPDSA